MNSLPNNQQSNTGEFAGMAMQDLLFIGRVEGEPVIQDGYAFITLRTYRRAPDANGQWTDVPQDVPVIVDDPGKIENLIAKYVNAGRTLVIKAEYQTWGNQNENHGFFAKMIKLGPKGVPAGNQGNNRGLPLR